MTRIGSQRRIDVAEEIGEPGEGQDRRRAADDGAEETADLRQGAGAEAEDRRDDDEREGDEVDRVHGRMVPQVGRRRPPRRRIVAPRMISRRRCPRSGRGRYR